MPHSVSALKRVRQNEKRRLRNKAVRTEIKPWPKRLAAAVAANDTALAKRYFESATKKLDKAAKVGVYHRNTVARKKSRIAKALNQLLAGVAARPAGAEGAAQPAAEAPKA